MFTPSYFPLRYFPERYFPTSGEVPSAVSAPKPSYAIHFRTDPQVVFWGVNEALMWTNDANVFWSAQGDWLPWSGSLKNLIHQQYEFRITVNSGLALGAITALTVNIDMPDVVEEVLNVAIGSSGTRVPLTKAFQSVKVVSPKLLDDGGTATHIKIVDKDTTGPLIKAFDASNVATTAHADVTVQGY